MKKLIASLLLVSSLSAFGQGTAIRSLNGLGTNLTVFSEFQFGSSTNFGLTSSVGGVTVWIGGVANTVWLPSLFTITVPVTLPNGSVGSPALLFSNDADTGLYSAGSGGEFSVAINGVQAWIFGNGAGGRMIRPATDNAYDIGTSALRPATIYSAHFVGNAFTGDGSGLTNLSFAAGPTYVFSGKAQFVSNVFFNVVSYSTNSASSETTIDLSKSYRAFATNNNTAFSALAGIETERTNIQSCNIFITNSSAAVKTVTMAASFQNMNAIEGNSLNLTNVGHLLVFFYPGFGTNFYWKSR